MEKKKKRKQKENKHTKATISTSQPKKSQVQKHKFENCPELDILTLGLDDHCESLPAGTVLV